MAIMWSNAPNDVATKASSAPDTQILSENDVVTVLVEVPGVEAKNIQVMIEDYNLTLSGERRVQKESNDKKRRSVEWMYEYFSRSIPLPENIDVSRKSTVCNGTLLKLIFPKMCQAMSEVA